MRALREELKVKRAILVCLAPRRRTTEDGIEVVPWSAFLKDLWSGALDRDLRH